MEHNKWYTWAVQVLGSVWSWLSDSRTLTAVTVAYTLTLFYFLIRDRIKGKKGKKDA